MSAGSHALVGERVVRATGRVDVVIAAVETARRRIDPALEPHGEFGGGSRRWLGRHIQESSPALAPSILRARARRTWSSLPGGSSTFRRPPGRCVSGKQVRREPLRLWREDVALVVDEQEAPIVGAPSWSSTLSLTGDRAASR